MAIEWAVSKKVRHDDIWKSDGEMRGAFKDAMIVTELIGVPRVTDRTFELYYKRYCMFCVVAGLPKPDRLYLWGLRGMSTNASSMTDAAFKHAMMKRLEKRVQAEG